jgi:outer membrane protease
MKKIAALLSIALLLCCCRAWAQAVGPAKTRGSTAKKLSLEKPKQKLRIDVEAGFDYNAFYTLYQIGGKIHTRDSYGILYFPLSELAFPLDSFFFYCNASIRIMEIVTFQGRFRKNMQKDVGKMKDSDWYPYPGIKTAYSESDTELNAMTGSGDILFRLFRIRFYVLQFGVGFIYQYFDFKCRNVLQHDVLSGPYRIIYIPLKSLTYEVNYYIPHLQLLQRFTFFEDRFNIDAGLQFSPYTWAKDIDDHLLRFKKSIGRSNGYAVSPSIELSYLFPVNVFIKTRLKYLYIRTRGEQEQSYYLPNFENNYIPGKYGTIENKLISHQLNISLGAGYSFQI